LSGETIIVKAFFWNEKDKVRSVESDLESKLGISSVGQYQTVLCVAFSTDITTINQAAEMVEDVF
jgi:hypothetical protein